MKIVDTRGEKCPKPIIDTKKALKETTSGETFTILTDSITSCKNISRYLTDNKIKFVVSEKKGIWTFEVTNETGNFQLKSEEVYCEPEQPERTRNGYAVEVGSEFMGRGDDQLGRILIRSFFVSISCLDELPEVMVFYNSGVKLAVRNSDVIDLLREIENKGVEIILCSTCIEHYKLESSVGAGKTGDMFQIVEKLSSARYIIKP